MKGTTYSDLGKALKQFHKRIEWYRCEADETAQDATIFHFQMSYDLALNVMHDVLLEHTGQDHLCNSQIVKASYKEQWIANRTLWTEMSRTRKRVIDLYNENRVTELMEKIPTYAKALSDLNGTLQNLK